MGAYSWKADFTKADLKEADLTDAILTGADLAKADLRQAVLTGADLMKAENLKPKQILSACWDRKGRRPTLPAYLEDAVSPGADSGLPEDGGRGRRGLRGSGPHGGTMMTKEKLAQWEKIVSDPRLLAWRCQIAERPPAAPRSQAHRQHREAHYGVSTGRCAARPGCGEPNVGHCRAVAEAGRGCSRAAGRGDLVSTLRRSTSTQGATLYSMHQYRPSLHQADTPQWSLWCPKARAPLTLQARGRNDCSADG